jgi:hypothetical protein
VARSIDMPRGGPAAMAVGSRTPHTVDGDSTPYDDRRSRTVRGGTAATRRCGS